MNFRGFGSKGRVIHEVLFQNLPVSTEENRDKHQNSWCPGRASNQAPPEYDRPALPLETTRLFEVYRTTLWIISCHLQENNLNQLFIFNKISLQFKNNNNNNNNNNNIYNTAY
jgi:hypothetical protein